LPQEPKPPPVPAPAVYLANADGSSVTLLTAGSRPSWSPDGTRILCVEEGEIYLVGVDGSRIGLGRGEDPAWAPDGQQLAFVNEEGIAVMYSDGSAVRTLLRHDFRDDTYAPSDMGIAKPAWSPDGHIIAFEHRGDGDIVPAQVFLMNADGSNPRRLTPTTGRQYAESDPAWSVDGSRLVFWSLGYGIATAPASGGRPQLIYSNFPAVAYGTKPVWTPDGRTIGFTANRFSFQPSIWTVPSEGGTARELLLNGSDAVWSPDGARIAFVRRRVP